MQDNEHIRHILHSCFSMANGLHQYYVMWMNAVNTSNTSVCEMDFCEKYGKFEDTSNV